MKILMINVVCGIRSTGRICTDLAVALEEQGHEVKIAYGREEVPEQFKKYAVRVGNDLDVQMHGIKARLFDKAGFGSRHVTEKFIKWIRQYDPDVIHLHNLHGYYINIEVLFEYLRNCGKKIIWTLHDCWSFTGHCVYFDYAGCGKWKTGCKKCVQKKEYPACYGIPGTAFNYRKKKQLFTDISQLTLITPSEWMAGLVKQSYLSNYPVKVIHNGVDTNIFKPTPSDIKERYGLLDKKIILGVAAIWDRRKGLNYMVDLADKLGDAYKVVVIGLSREQINQLPENILGIQRTNSVQELIEWYTAAEVFVNPTLEDNYPTTNLEAIACGTPCITFNTGGSPESAKVFGAVASKGRIDEISDIIRANNFKQNRRINSSIDMITNYKDLYERLFYEKI